VRWGVIGTAKIALTKVIPGMQRGQYSRVVAIASRSGERAEQAARTLGLAQAFGSYDALLADRSIDAVYIPLPNNQHVHWAERAADSGKHVLVEKPVGMNAAEAAHLLAVRDRCGVLIQEAFMIRAHPQWEMTLDRVRGGAIGAVQSVAVCFSYRNLDPANIRNQIDAGGGALMDIGCYIIHSARAIFGREPARVAAVIDDDPEFRVDRLTSMLLDFGGGCQAIGTCATQAVPAQRVQIIGDRGRLEIEIPFNAPPDRACRLWIDDGSHPGDDGRRQIEIPAADQYTIQGDRFSHAILTRAAAPLPLEDAVANMRVIDAVRRAAATRTWAPV
jgi:predicted dehydrogenase